MGSIKKTAKPDAPHAVFKNGKGWTFRVLRVYALRDASPYARWLVDVSSPFTYGGSDMGDSYAAEIVRECGLPVELSDEFEHYFREVWANAL